jgi:glycosyltransferase involved in cell wall biosynthesis
MKKRVAIISEHVSPLTATGGTGNSQSIYVARLAEYLAKQRFIVDIFTRKITNNQENIENWQPGVNVIYTVAGGIGILDDANRIGFMGEFTNNMLAYMRKEHIRYDVIHASCFTSALVASNIKKYLNIPYVVTFHALGLVRRMYQTEKDSFPPIRYEIEKFIVTDADYLIAGCPQDKEDLIYHYHAAPYKITMVPYGFSSEEFFPIEQMTARNILGLDTHEAILLHVGSLTPRKGVDNIIKALAFINKTVRKVRLLVVGGEMVTSEKEAAEVARLKQLAADEGITANVTFTGYKRRELLKYYYAAADVFISTPWYEPFGITPLEAMACGTPVIGSNIGGLRYTIADGETGTLVPANDPVALARTVYSLFVDAEKMLDMSEAAIERVNRYFTWEKVSNAIGDIYEEVIRLHKKPANAKVVELSHMPTIASLFSEPAYYLLNAQ